MMQNYSKFEQAYQKPLSIAFILSSSFAQSCITLFVKLLPGVPAYQIIQTQNVIMYFLLYPSSSKVKFPTYRETRRVTVILFFRCFLYLTSTICWFKGAMYISAAETEIVYNMSPFWTCIYTVFIQKSRKFSMQIVVIFALLLSGLTCLSQGKNFQQTQIDDNSTNNKFISDHSFGLILLIFGSLQNSLIEICVSKLTQNNVLVNNILICVLVGGIFGSSIIQIFSPQESLIQLTIKQYLSITLMSLLAIFYLFCYTLAFKLGEISTVSILQLMTLVFGFIFDIFIFKIKIHLLTVLGTILILSGIMMNLLTKSESSNEGQNQIINKDQGEK